MCVSLLGDGVFMVALGLAGLRTVQSPSAMAIVGIAMTVPTIVCLLVGGAASDRFDRRRVMLVADATRAAALALLAVARDHPCAHARRSGRDGSCLRRRDRVLRSLL